jgi:hypothetical protein
MMLFSICQSAQGSEVQEQAIRLKYAGWLDAGRSFNHAKFFALREIVYGKTAGISG